MTRSSAGSKTGSVCYFLDEIFEWVDHLQALGNDSRIHGLRWQQHQMEELRFLSH